MNSIKMKRIPALSLLIAGVALLLGLTNCSKPDNGLNPQTPASALAVANNTMATLAADTGLIAYKNRPHEIYAGFYRVQGPCYGPGLNGSDFSKVPDSLDVLILFCLNGNSPIAGSVPGWVNALHAKGTKVIVTGGLDLVAGATHDSVGYAKTAKYIMDSIVNRFGLDGYDIDVENNPSGQALTDMVGVYKALSKYLGPKSGTGKLLTFDTNQNGDNNMFRQVYSLVNYVWLQAYGRGANTLQSTWNTFAPYIASTQFIPGFSFYEENGQAAGNIWYDVTYPVNGTGRAFDYARWEPTGGSKKGGVFSYAIDRDAPLTSSTDNNLYVPNYIVSKKLIQIMNPAGGSSTTVGVQFFQDAYYGGTATQLIPKGNYTLASFATYGMINDWASSVKIPAGWTVTMYADDNFSGTSWTLSSSNNWFGALSPNANDKVSSFKIQ